MFNHRVKKNHTFNMTKGTREVILQNKKYSHTASQQRQENYIPFCVYHKG